MVGKSATVMSYSLHVQVLSLLHIIMFLLLSIIQ